MRAQKRNNAVYKGQRRRGFPSGTEDRDFVDAFYNRLNQLVRPHETIEIIPPEQVHPTHSLQDQLYIVTYYCVSQILPEMTCLFDWGAKVTPRLRALAPIVDVESAKAVQNAAEVAYDVTAKAHTGHYSIGNGTFHAKQIATRAARGSVFDEITAAENAAHLVYNVLFGVIAGGNEAAYDRIIELTNEMLESL
jgi:hypothetical protein